MNFKSIKAPKFKLKYLIIALIIILVVVAAGWGIYQYQKVAGELASIKSDPNKIQEAAKSEQKKLIEQVGKLIALPANEEPTVATVTDPEKLKDQPFFNNAQNGDKVLIYPNAKKAILFRPSINKIIDIAPINLNANQPATSSASVSPSTSLTPATQPVKFFLLNGTTHVGLTQKYEISLKKALPDVLVVDRDNAKKNDYAKTILIDISGTKTQEADQISKLLNIPVEKLPEGEVKPEGADFLIILGEDRK